ncbi:MAG: AzlD domain-containing protein [Alcaligenaceae bacterium]|nr:AzlD domain-containing protein [Alcaligenaceae bacterium]
MSVDYVLKAIALLLLCSFITRVGYLLIGAHIPLTENIRSALRYAPVAALVAIIVPSVLPWAQGEAPQLGAELFAGLVAGLAFFRFRSILLLIAAGMGSLWLFRWIA